jgi:hypothetical protein
MMEAASCYTSEVGKKEFEIAENMTISGVKYID